MTGAGDLPKKDLFHDAPSIPLLASELADREAIRDCLFRYCRGIDRVDTALAKSAYWPEATDNHGMRGRTAMPAYKFVDRAARRLLEMEQTAHSLNNILIRIRGRAAAVESYFVAYHRLRGPNGPFDLFVGGRYLDRMTRRGEEWRIEEREVVVDWFREEPNSGDWDAGFFGSAMSMGQRAPGDRSNVFFDVGQQHGVASAE